MMKSQRKTVTQAFGYFPPAPKFPRRAAFTLVETIIASTLFTVVILAIMSAFVFGLRSARVLDRAAERCRMLARTLSRFTESVEHADAAWAPRSGDRLLLMQWTKNGLPPGWASRVRGASFRSLLSRDLLDWYWSIPSPVPEPPSKGARRQLGRGWRLPPLVVRLPPGLIRTRFRLILWRVVHAPGDEKGFVLLEIPIWPDGEVVEVASGLKSRQGVFEIEDRMVRLHAELLDAPDSLFLDAAALLSGPCGAEQALPAGGGKEAKKPAKTKPDNGGGGGNKKTTKKKTPQSEKQPVGKKR